MGKYYGRLIRRRREGFIGGLLQAKRCIEGGGFNTDMAMRHSRDFC
jgi:hypothetical protein